jgi:predicted metalloprotease with PDZ domain
VRYQLPLCAAVLVFSLPVWAAKKVDLDYHITLLPQSDQAQVSLTLEQGNAVRSLDLDLGEPGQFSDFNADGQWSTANARSGNALRGVWKPASGKATLTYRVHIDRPTPDALNGKPRYASRMTADWALFRGEDLVPRARLDQQDGIRLQTRMTVDLPSGWKNVETSWPRIGKNRFRIDDVSRLFDRPSGWMLAGNLIHRRARLGETEVTVSAPKGQGMRRMETLTLLTFVWPRLQAVFPRTPDKLLVVGASDSMARNPSAGHDSIYLNASRPLISESGASPLLRELVQVFGRIEVRDRSDWIRAGVAEYYSVELLRRAGGMTQERFEDWQSILTRVGRKVTTLRAERVDPAMTARAAMLLSALDQEIRQQTRDQKSLDDVIQGLVRMGKVSTEDFAQLAGAVTGEPSKVLASSLLQ